MDTIGKFNKLVGLIFGSLYEQFPQPVVMNDEKFRGDFDDFDEKDAFDFRSYFESTIRWLENAGYIWIEQDKSSFDGPEFDVVLSEKGLEALRRVPVSLEGTASIGERLVQFSKTKASEALSTLISLAITTGVKSAIGVS